MQQFLKIKKNFRAKSFLIIISVLALTVVLIRIYPKQDNDPSVQLSEAFNRYNSTILIPLSEWGVSELELKNIRPQKIFYPFGGADIITVETLFPNASEYLLIGLEPFEPVPQIRDDGAYELSSNIKNIQKVFSSIFHWGFFITHRMKTDIDTGRFPGVSSMLIQSLLLLKADNITIGKHCIDYSGIENVSTSLEPCGRAITYTRNGIDKRVMYLKMDLSDEQLLKNSYLQNFFKTWGPYVSFLKAAQYLLHQNEFSLTRSFVLASIAVLQDDSGVPYRFFNTGDWDVALYGKYKVIDSFTRYTQTDLVDAYQKQPIRNSPLRLFGYGNRTQGANAILAVKK